MAAIIAQVKDAFIQVYDNLKTPYVNRTDCKVLAEYKYHSVAGTKLDQLLNNYWWTPLSNYVPLSVHPNSLTVAGLIASYALSFLPLALANPQFDHVCPGWIYLLAAFGFFAYQTLDALDGKQARRTKLSSPMGQMMDHGCDSLTTFLSLFICCSACQLGTGPIISLQLALMTIQLYLYSWYECTYGIFRACTGDYFGVTEGQWAIILINLAAFWWPGIWASSLSDIVPGIFGSILGLITFNFTLAQMTYYFGNSVLLYLAYTDFSEILTTRHPPNVSKAVKEWAQIGFHVYCNVALVLGEVLRRQPQLTTTLITISGSLVAWRLIMSCVSKAKLRLIQWPSIPFYVTSILCSCRVFGPVTEMIVLLLTTAWMSLALLTFVHVNMTLIKEYLGLTLFVVPGSQDTPQKLVSLGSDAFVSPTAKTEASICNDNSETQEAVPVTPN